MANLTIENYGGLRLVRFWYFIRISNRKWRCRCAALKCSIDGKGSLTLNSFYDHEIHQIHESVNKLANAFSCVSCIWWFEDGQITYCQILVAGAYIGVMLGGGVRSRLGIRAMYRKEKQESSPPCGTCRGVQGRVCLFRP